MCKLTRTVLLIAAEAREFTGLLSRTGGDVLRWPVTFATAVERNGVRTIMVANGPGPHLAGRAADIAMEQVRPDSIVSTGLCGALAPELRLGEVLVADRILDEQGAREYRAEPLTSGRQFATGTVLSIDRVASTVSDKRSMRAKGAIAVEMEAAGVAARASESKIPFFCVRSVSDTADEELVLDFNAYRDQDGRFSRPRIVAAALRRPWSRFPGLMRLDRHSRHAAETLGEFLVDCRF